MNAQANNGEELVVRQAGGETQDLPLVLPRDLKVQQLNPLHELLDQSLREGLSLQIGVHDSNQLIMRKEGNVLQYFSFYLA